MLIDTHAHLDMEDYNDDLDKVIERALECGINHIISVGIDFSSSVKALELADRYDFIFSTIGYHPHNADDTDFDNIKGLSELASESKVVAWGEIGLDFFRNRSKPEKQIEVFEQQLEMANQTNLPVIIHDRDAHTELLDILNKNKGLNNRGVIHCFSGDFELAMVFIDMGYYISIPGTVTYKNANKVQDVAARIPIDRILVETDAPFLTPVPKRGKRNEPSFVAYTAREIARLRDMDFDEFAKQSSRNAKRLFNIP